nr:hypothetical protein [Tanacetum cinerariifolium]
RVLSVLKAISPPPFFRTIVFGLPTNCLPIYNEATSHMVEEDKAPPEVDMSLVDKHLHLAGMRMVDKYIKLAYTSKEMMQNKLWLRLVDFELPKLVVVHST